SAHRQTHRRGPDDQLHLAIAMRRSVADGRPDRRARPSDGGEAMNPTLQLCLIISAALFSIGLLAALSRKHAVFILIGIELMLAAATLNFIAFWRFGPDPQNPAGVMVDIFSIAIAPAAAVVGLAVAIAGYRH